MPLVATPVTLDYNTIAVIITTAIFSCGLGWFFSQKLNNMASDFYKALNEHKDQDNVKFTDHAIRLSRLELDAFGWTHSGKNPDNMDLLS